MRKPSPIPKAGLNVRLPIDLVRKVQEEADKREVATSFIVRKALERYLREMPSKEGAA